MNINISINKTTIIKELSSPLFEGKNLTKIDKKLFFKSQEKFIIGSLENEKERFVFSGIEEEKTPKVNQSYFLLAIDKNWCQEIQGELFGELEEFIPLKSAKISDRTLFREYKKLNKLVVNDKYSYFKKRVVVLDFLKSLFKKYCDSSILKVEEAKRYMKNNVCERLSVEDLCKQTKLSKYYFMRIFREHTKTTPHNYLLNLKIEKAKKLLQTDMKTSEVAVTVGFTDQSHFSKVFKEFSKTTPSDFIRSCKKSA